MLRLNSPKKCIGPKLSLQVCILRRRHSRATGNLSAIYQQFIRPFSADEFEDNFKVLCLLRFQRPIMRTSIQFIANWNCWETKGVLVVITVKGVKPTPSPINRHPTFCSEAHQPNPMYRSKPSLTMDICIDATFSAV